MEKVCPSSTREELCVFTVFLTILDMFRGHIMLDKTQHRVNRSCNLRISLIRLEL